MNLNNFGTKLRVTDSSKNAENKEKLLFIRLVTELDNCWIRTSFLHSQLKVDFWNYEEHFYHIIEDLIYLHFDEWKADLILWFVYDRIDAEGNILDLEITPEDKPAKKYKLKTAEELWKIIEKIDKVNNKGKKDE
jgi:hypothetical protein